jgi:HPr kinase/phosphorylase
MIQMTVADLLQAQKGGLELSLVAGGKGLSRRITNYRIQKSGLTLTGLFDNVHSGRIQILGNNEIKYLATLVPDQQKIMLEGVAKREVPCFIITRGLEAPDSLIDVCERLDVPLLRSFVLSSTFIIRIDKYLENNLASSTTVHGVLVDVHGVGVLLIGKSGVGKSECALDLLIKGHRLIADDIVQVKKAYPNTIWGACSPVVRHHMEVRGLGIINVADLFGVNSVRDSSVIDLVLELVEWHGGVEYDRLGLEHKTYRILEEEIPLLTLPVSQGRNLASIVEVAARNHILREQGIDSALRFQEKLDASLIRERLSRGPSKKSDNSN